MGKSQPKRRATTTRPHQTMKGKTNKKNVNWIRITLIIVGIMIVISMILSMVLVPGSPLGF